MKRGLKWTYLLVVIIIMGLIEKNMTYWPKSLFKIFLFLIVPYLLFKPKYNYKKIIISKKAKVLSLAVLVGLFFGYFILGNFMDYEAIKVQLNNMMDINRRNFFWIAIYISLINAAIEEFFFRGIYFLEEGENRNTFTSALTFAIYHIAIMDTWVSLPLLALGSFGLLLVGLVFNYLTLESQTIYSSYFVHLVANLTLNAIAFIFIL